MMPASTESHHRWSTSPPSVQGCMPPCRRKPFPLLMMTQDLSFLTWPAWPPGSPSSNHEFLSCENCFDSKARQKKAATTPTTGVLATAIGRPSSTRGREGNRQTSGGGLKAEAKHPLCYPIYKPMPTVLWQLFSCFSIQDRRREYV